MPSNPGPRLVATWRCKDNGNDCCHLVHCNDTGQSRFWCNFLEQWLEASAITPIRCPYHPKTTARPEMRRAAGEVSERWVQDEISILENNPLS